MDVPVFGMLHVFYENTVTAEEGQSLSSPRNSPSGSENRSSAGADAGSTIRVVGPVGASGRRSAYREKHKNFAAKKITETMCSN